MNIIKLDDKELRRYQMCVLDVASDFADVCEKYDLDYSLGGGSVLGAIRHQGFIPWDDDIDLNITRESYDKLLKIFEKELGINYVLQTPQTNPELGLMVSQIRKRGTVARRKYDIGLEECGVSIDLYIVENVFDNKILRTIQKYMSLFCAFAISTIRTCKNKDIPDELIQMEGRSLNYLKLKKLLNPVFKIIPLEKWISWCDFWNSLCKNTKTEFVAIPTGRGHFNKEFYLREDMCKYKKVDFESRKFNVPVSSEKYLEHLYGDYMKVPPVEKREQHLFLELDF